VLRDRVEDGFLRLEIVTGSVTTLSQVDLVKQPG
jgi:hypothetical protein